MKRLSLLICFIILASCFQAFSQDDGVQEGVKKIPERLKLFKEKYEFTFNQPFEIVFKGVLNALEKDSIFIQTKNNTQDTAGFHKAFIRTDFVILAKGSDGDTSRKALNHFSTEDAFIRGGIWVSARIGYTIRLIENKDGSTNLILKGKTSGFENYVTRKVQEYESNGILETELLEKIKKSVEETAAKDK